MNPNAAFKVQKVRFKDNFLGVYESGDNVELKFEFNTVSDKENGDKIVLDTMKDISKQVKETIKIEKSQKNSPRKFSSII